MLKKLGLATLAIVACIGVAFSQSNYWPSLPIVGSAAYCSATGNNSVCTNTVPAGPTTVTGNENLPANTNLSSGQPQNVLMPMAMLNALPVTFVTATTSAAVSGISASNVSGGVVYYYATAAAITSANITLPVSPLQGQRYVVASNRTISSLNVSAGAGSTMAENTGGTVILLRTLSSVTFNPGVQAGFEFIYDKANTRWSRTY